MKTSDVCIPAALQLVLDDIGWMKGRDERDREEPSRTGMPRTHVLADYQVVEALGKALNQKINTMLVIGEWDKNARLRNATYSNKWGKDWDPTPFLNLPEQEKIRDFVNSAEHIEFGLHGLLHDLFYEGKNICGQEFAWPRDMVKGAPKSLAPEWFLREHFDIFYEILNDWSFRKPIRSFAFPGGAKDYILSGKLTPVLKDYGIRFWHNGIPQSTVDRFEGKIPSLLQNGILIHRKVIEICPWEAYDLDPEILEDIPLEKAGIVGGHWVNLLRYNPAKNMERVEAWASYFNRQGETFGIILSRDVEFAHHQQYYHHHGIQKEENGKIILDLSHCDRNHPAPQLPPVYVSIRKSVSSPRCTGGILERYEERGNFINYKITRNGSNPIVLEA